MNRMPVDPQLDSLRNRDSLRDSLTAHATLLTELLAAKTAPALKAAGVSNAIFDLLSAVRAAGGRATQNELANRLGVKPPTLSEAAQLAIRQGLLEVFVLPGDRRAKLLRLSPSGKQTLQRIMREISSAERECLEGIDPDELSVAIEVLRKASMNLARSSTAD